MSPVWIRVILLIIVICAPTSCAFEARYDIESGTSWTQSDTIVYYFRGVAPDTTLRAVNLTGANDHVVEESVREFSFSPNSSMMAVVLRTGGCSIIDLENEITQHRLDSCGRIVWGPREKILVGGPSTGGFDVIDLSTLERREVIRSRGTISSPLWSGDGRSVFYVELQERRYFAVDVESGRLDDLGQGESGKTRYDALAETSGVIRNQGISIWDHAWLEQAAPSGSFVATALHGNLEIEDVRADSKRVLLRNRGWITKSDFSERGFESPCWTPDEKFVVGELEGVLVVVDVVTGRNGSLTEGRRPTIRVPGYPFNPGGIRSGQFLH